MTLLQRISRNIFFCDVLIPKWIIRRSRNRKEFKLLVVFFLLFLIYSILPGDRKSHEAVVRKGINEIPLDDGYITVRNVPEYVVRKDINEIPVDEGYSVVRNAPDYDVKEEPVARHLMGLKNCSRHPNGLLGPMLVNPNVTPSMEEVKHAAGPDILHGGCYIPSSCKPRQKVAIIIPFKDRDAHLKTLMYYLHPMLKRQQIHYCIYVTEQYDAGQFNKAMIMNAGFMEAIKLDLYDCIVFHDVDMIPEDDRNMYLCGDQPRHLSPAIDKFQYKPHYGTEFGGVTAITTEQYWIANGHSNEFWGWGGEDNDMEFRIGYNNMKIIPSSLKIGRYKMIVHKHPWKFSPNKFPYRLNQTREIRARTDGLGNLDYRLNETIKHPLYTKFMIDIRRIEVKRITLYVDGKAAMDIDIAPGPCRWERFEGKYLDKSIELSQVKEAAHLQALRMNLPTKTYPWVPPEIEKSIPKPKKPDVRFTVIENFTDAINLCNKLYPECQAVQQENADKKYSLRQSNMPRHIVISGPNQISVGRHGTGKDEQVPQRKYYFPFKTIFLKYCPGESGQFQALKKPFVIDLTNLTSTHEYTYHFTVHFSILLEPATSLYYRDSKNFEAQMSKGQNYYTFNWPNRKRPNFSNPETPREFTFETVQFSIPRIPGCYAVESKIQDRYDQPYFQWNWWFEVTTNDKSLDAKTRDEYYRNQVKQKAALYKATKEEDAARRREVLKNKKGLEFQKQMANLHNKELKIQEEHLRKMGSMKAADDLKKVRMNNIHEENDENPPQNAGSIKVFDPDQTIPPVAQALPANKQVEKRKVAVRKAFHNALPSHVQQKNQPLDKKS